MQQRLQGGAQQTADHPAGGKVPDIISVDSRQPAGRENQRQRTDQTQRDGEIIDVLVVFLMTPRKPAAADNNDRNGVSHYAKNEK